MIVTSFYILVTKNGDTEQIDEETANAVANAIEDNILRKIWVSDIVGSRTMVTLSDVSRIYETTPEIRDAIRTHNKAVQTEDPSWES